MVLYVEMDAEGTYTGGGTLELRENRSGGQGSPRMSGVIRGPRLAGVAGGSLSLTLEFEADMSCGGE